MRKSKPGTVPYGQNALLITREQILSIVRNIDTHDFVARQLWYKQRLSLLLCLDIEHLDIARRVAYEQESATFGSEYSDTARGPEVRMAILLVQLVRHLGHLHKLKNLPLNVVEVLFIAREQVCGFDQSMLRLLYLLLVQPD